jgi:hypothetical protein
MKPAVGKSIQLDKANAPIFPNRIGTSGEPATRTTGTVFEVTLKAGTGTAASGNRKLAPSVGNIIELTPPAAPIPPTYLATSGEPASRPKPPPANSPPQASEETPQPSTAASASSPDVEETVPPSASDVRKECEKNKIVGAEQEQMVKALTVSRSGAEAMGEIGMYQAMEGKGHTRHPDFIKRYHGPDEICLDKNGNLVEWEAKGRAKNSTDLSVSNSGSQCSDEKNKNRGEKLTKKKIGDGASTQGGKFTDREIKLWDGIERRDGEKQHYSAHVNTGTGTLVVCHRGKFGESLNEETTDIKNFTNKQTVINKLFSSL